MRRRAAVLGLLAAAAAPGRRGGAQERAALYQATAIVTGTDMRERPAGFSRCLLEVFGKVTGNPRLREDARAAALAARAEAFVAAFEYVDPRAGLLHHDDQGTYDRSYELTVRFDPARVDAALAGLGVAAWRGARPLLEPMVLVRDREPVPFYLGDGTARGREMRAAVVRAAGECGVGVRFPTEADLDAMGVGTVGFPAPLDEAGAGLARVVGTLSWSVRALGWVGVWRMGERQWGESGVGFDVALGEMVRGAVMVAAGTGIP